MRIILTQLEICLKLKTKVLKILVGLMVLLSLKSSVASEDHLVVVENQGSSWVAEKQETNLKLPRVLTLVDAIQYALSYFPVLDSARKTRVIRDLEHKNAFARLLPSLDLSTTHGVQNNISINNNYTLLTPNATAPWYSSINLGLTENLYDNGVSLTQLSIAKKNQEIADLSAQKEQAQLILSIATEFYNFSKLFSLIEVRQKQLDILEKQFQILSSQYQQGLKPQLDFLRLKAQVQRAQIEKTVAEKNVTLSEISLRKMIGMDVNEDHPFKFKAVSVRTNKGIERRLPNQAPSFESFYDYKISAIQKEINEQTVSFAKRRYWPQVFFTGGVNYSNFNYLSSTSPFETGNQMSYSALLTVQYNFWDWGIRRRDVEIAQVNRDIQDNSVTLKLLDLRASINSLMVDLSRVKLNYSLNQELLLNENQNYKNIDLQYREGKSSYLDLITSLSNLLDAKVQFYNAYFEVLQILTKYYFYEGSVYEKISKIEQFLVDN